VSALHNMIGQLVYYFNNAVDGKNMCINKYTMNFAIGYVFDIKRK